MAASQSLAQILFDPVATTSPNNRPYVDIGNLSNAPIPVAVMSGGTAATQYTSAATVSGNPTGMAIVFNNAGTWATAGSVTPLPISGTITPGSSAAINDGVVTTQKATVAQFHNADNQNPGGTAYGLLTGGVAQLLNIDGNIDRQRETGTDNVPAQGISTGSMQMAMSFNGLMSVDATGAGVRTFTPTSPSTSNSGTIAGVPWWIKPGTVLSIDTGVNQEWIVVTATNGTVLSNGQVVTAGTTFQATTLRARSGTTNIPFTGFTYNQERDAAGELDGATGSGTALAVDYLYNGGAGATSGNYDRERSLSGLGLFAGALSTATQGTSSLVFSGTPTGLQPGTPIFLYTSSAAGTVPSEVVYVSTLYVSGTTVPITSTIQTAGITYARFSANSVIGPGIAGFLPTGEGAEIAGIFSNAQQLYYLIRSAEVDAMPLASVPMENAGLYNGTTFDRQRSVLSDAQAAIGIEAATDMLYNGSTFDRARSATADAMAITGVEAASDMLWNGSSFDRARSAVSDALATTGIEAASEMLWNGSSFDRARSATIGDNVAPTGIGADSFYVVTAAAGGVASLSPLRTPSVFKTITATASGSTALWTPAGGKKFRAMRYIIEVTGNAAIASGGVLTIDLLDSAASFNNTHSVWVPASAQATTPGGGFSTGWIDLGNGYLSTTANNILNVSLSAALTAGLVRVTIAGTEES
jgi:hypothetical protein